jgi:hypothetical protein
LIPGSELENDAVGGEIRLRLPEQSRAWSKRMGF